MRSARVHEAEKSMALNQADARRASDERGPATFGKEAAKANAQGVELLKNAQHEEAVERFKLALTYEAGSVQILNNIGLAYAKMQDFGAAYEWYEKAYLQDRSDVETLFSLAWVERKRSRYTHAKELFQKVLDLQPDHGKALYLLGDILKTNQDFEGATHFFERYVRLEPNNVDGQISLAQCCEHTKQYQRAVQLYSKLLQLDPSRLDVTFFLGRGHYMLKQYKQCVACFDRIPDSDARAFEARTYGAKACRELEDHSTAIAYAERAAQFKPHADVMHFIGEEYLHRSDMQKAAHWFNKAIETDPKHVNSLNELGQLMYRDTRFQQAEAYFSRVLELDRSNVSALKNLALVKYKLKKLNECRTYCDTAVRLDPLNADALWLLAELNKDLGEETWFLNLRYPPEIAVADVCQTIAKGYITRRQPKEGLAWLQKVQNYSASDLRVKEAIKLLTKYEGSNPQDVLDVLEKRHATTGSAAVPASSPALASSFHANGTRSQAPATAAALGSGAADDTAEDLEKLIRRAERAGTRPGSGVDQWNEVMAKAKAALRKRPNDALALKCIARALLSTGGDVAEIKEYARRATENGDDKAGSFNLGYELHAYLAAAHERERDLTSAERHFTAALLSKPGDEIAQLGLARVYMQRSETAKARQLFEQVSKSYPNSAEAQKRLGEISLQAGEHNEAYRFASKATKLDASDLGAFICLGQACAKVGRTDEAIRALEQGLGSSSSATDASAMKVLADLQRRAGRDQDAMTWYKRLVDLRPSDLECILNLAQLHASKGAGGASQALHHYRNAMQCRPSAKDMHTIYVQMTDVQYGIKAWKDAQQTLERATREFPEDVELWSKLLNVYGQLQDKLGQERCHKKLATFDSMSISKRIAYGDALESQGQPQQARDQYMQVLRAEPANIQAQLKLAVSYRQDTSNEKNLEEAGKCFDQVLKTSPNNSEALEGAAYCHRKMQDWDTAVQLYQLCLKARPLAEVPLYYLGDILYKQHRHAECQHYLMRLVESPTVSEDFMKSALYTLAKSNVSLDEYEKAEQYARRGLTKWHNHPHFLFILALVKNRVAEYDESISILQQALQNSDASEENRGGGDTLRLEIRDWLAQAFERKRDYRAAMTQLDLAFQQDANHVSSLITKGLVQIQLKQLDQAEASFRKALSIEKNHALALVRMGYCKLLNNDQSEAATLFQLALQQRCGTVALPQSVKGTARVYLALALMGQQDISAALLHLGESKKSHKNFREVCTHAKEAIVKGECEGLVNRLKAICDLDVNTAQAWQLVHLMAKELEIDMRDIRTPNDLGGASAPATSSASKASSIADPSALGPRIEPRPGAGAASRAGYNPISLLPPTGGAVPASSSTAPSTGADGQERRQWAAPASEAPARRGWSAQPESQEANAASGQDRRQWTTPVAAPEPQPVRPGSQLRLELREQIDIKDLKYNKEDCLGTGGFGSVYRGFFKDEEVAIKKIHCEDGGNISALQLEELEKEVANLKELNHPRLVRFIGASLQPPNLCIVTEYMAGGSLHHLLHKNKTTLTLQQQYRMSLQVSEGVAFLHSRVPPVIHRDLKSLNIILDRVYNAKICDFGLTQSMEKTHISLKDGNNGGSPRYMAPECYDSKGKITDKVDVWAVGCLLVEIFGGPLPYDDCSNIQQIIAKLLIEKQLPHVPHYLPRGVRGICEDCFNFDVSQRAKSQDVLRRLRQLKLAPEGD